MVKIFTLLFLMYVFAYSINEFSIQTVPIDNIVDYDRSALINQREYLYTFAEETVEEEFPYSTVVEYDETLNEGYEEVKVVGKNGKSIYHFQVKYEGEEEISRSRYFTEVIDEVTDEVIIKGSKKKDKPVIIKDKEVEKDIPPKIDKIPDKKPVTCSLQSSGDRRVQLMNEINYSRCQNGVTQLTYSSTLQSYANIRAVDITTHFSHKRPDGSSGYSLNESLIHGENLYSGHDSATSVFNALQNSATHKKNNQNPRFKSIGVGYEFVEGIAYWVILFSVY